MSTPRPSLAHPALRKEGCQNVLFQPFDAATTGGTAASSACWRGRRTTRPAQTTFHRKEKTLQNLRRKAEERNPDEFYYAMQNARTRNGVPHQEVSGLWRPPARNVVYLCAGIGNELCQMVQFPECVRFPYIRSATEPNKYSQEQLRLFKGQDIGYLSAKKQSEAKVLASTACPSFQRLPHLCLQ